MKRASLWGGVELATLRGLLWDHPRCTEPMRAAAAVWASLHPDTKVEFSVRALSAFNDEPLEQAALGYDLVIFDHPMVGAAAQDGIMLALDEVLPEVEPQALSGQTVGGSQESYLYEGHVFAIAVDAACQVAAVREDILESSGHAVPRTWPEVVALGAARPGLVALPFSPTDMFCSLLSLAASFGCPFSSDEGFADVAPLATLVELAKVVHPCSFGTDPPTLLELVAVGDEVGYVPLTFGYSNYARPGGAKGHALHFTDAPAHSPAGSPVSVLGGAGLGVPAGAPHPREAAAFTLWLAQAATQRYVIGPNGGQPASRDAWSDPRLDALAGGFFSGTIRTIESSWRRPRNPWWPGFQREAAGALSGAVKRGAEPKSVLAELQELLAAHRSGRSVASVQGGR